MADGPITKRLYLTSSMTSERIYNKVGLRFAPLRMFIFLNLQLLKLQLMLDLEQSRLTWSQTRTFLFTLLMENRNTNNNNDDKANARGGHLHVLSFLCVRESCRHRGHIGRVT